MGQKERITYLDMAKSVGCMLMVVGHLIGALQSIDNKVYFAPVYHFIASFHMPLFFIISGILLFITKEENRHMKEIVSRKTKTLMIPYLSFSVINLINCTYNCFVHPDLVFFSDLYERIIYSVTLRGVSVLWFLPTLYIGELIFLWCRKRLDDKKLILTFSVTGILMFMFAPVLLWEGWNENYGLMAVEALLHTAARSLLSCTFLMIGYFSTLLLQKHKKKSIPGFLLGAAMLAGCIVLCFQNDTVDFNYMLFNNVPLYVICACLGSFGVILLCKNFYQSRIMIFFGANSLVLMATHMEFFVTLYAIRLSYWINTFVTRAKEYVLFFTMAVIIMVAEAGIIYIYNHYLYFLIGKKKPEKAVKPAGGMEGNV